MYWTVASVFLVAWGFLRVNGVHLHGFVDGLLAVALAGFAAHLITTHRRRRGSGKLAVLLPLVVAALGAGRAVRAATPMDLPPVYHSSAAIDDGPARLVGDKARLTVTGGHLTGRLERGSYDVAITPTAAHGSAPMGAVDVRIKREDGGFDIQGTWNGGPMHLVIDDQGIRGTAWKQVSDEDRGYQVCHYDLERAPHGGGYTGLADCLGASPLRFDVRPEQAGALSEEQNAVLLAAYLAAPPAIWNP